MLPIIAALPESPDDRQFMGRLYEEYESLLYATALKYTASHPDAEEIVQECVVKLMGKTSTLRGMERCVLAGYLVAAVRNTAIRYLQKERSRQKQAAPMEEVSAAELPAQELSLDELMILWENRRRVKAAWPLLPESDRYLLEGKYLLNLSDEALAAQLHCKSDSVRMKLTRARRRAWKLIEKQEAKENDQT